MLNHFMAELGCDYPEITLRLDRNYLPAGEFLTGSFLFWPEILEGTDNPIEIEFVMLAQSEYEVKENVINVITTDEFVVAGDDRTVVVPFRYQLAKWLPVSTHAIRYYLRPKLPTNYTASMEPASRVDSLYGLPAIIVQPNHLLQSVMDTLFSLGYQEKPDSRYWDGVTQEFDFVASRDNPALVQEFSLTFVQARQQLVVRLQCSAQEPLLFEVAESDDTLAEQLVAWLLQALQNPNS